MVVDFITLITDIRNYKYFAYTLKLDFCDKTCVYNNKNDNL